MRLLIIILAVAVAVLLVGEHCEARAGLRSSPRHIDQLYGRALNACHDELVEWGKTSTVATGGAEETTPSSSSSGKRNRLRSATFMRGKWHFLTGDSSTVTRPSFLPGSHGKFDFVSPRVDGLMEEMDNHPIRNISGQIYFWQADGKNRLTVGGGSLAVGGMYDSHSGEVCMVACETKAGVWKPQGRRNGTLDGNVMTPFNYSDETCGKRILLTVSHKRKGGRKTATGTLESLRNSTQEGYFTKIRLDGKMVDSRDQLNLYRWDVFTKAAILAVEVVIIMWQIYHSFRSPSGYFVSMLMILVQIVVISSLSFVSIIYIPWRLFTLKRFKFLVSNLSTVPLLVALSIVIFLNVVFLLVVLRKRRVAKRLNVVERPKEAILAIICLVIYAGAAVALWSSHNFESYVQVVWCWFLLPQVVANVFWDQRLKPLHWVYVVGVSLCRIIYIGFNSVRPTIYGFDDFEDFPHGWFWGITGTVCFFGTYALLQQHYGGRCFLPQRWFGYKQLPTSRAQANEQQSFAKDEDTMLDL